MAQQSASATVAVPLAEVEDRLRRITTWSWFLVGVEEVVKTSHERYLFRLDDGREVPVAVRMHPREHSFTWHALSGPAFEGSLRLSPLDERNTRLTLQLTVRPVGFVANLAEMIGGSRAWAEIDLQRLDSYVRV